MNALPNVSSPEVAGDVAILPVGSHEQHGPHLPLVTDTIIAATVARAIAESYAGLWLLPPVCFGCSHEHAGFRGTVSIRAATLYALVTDIADDLRRQGAKLLIVNGHGGNNVLVHVAQEANVAARQLALFPTSGDWTAARQEAGCLSTTHQDMHAGEAETSILLQAAPDYARDGWQDDHDADDRPLLTLTGMAAYTTNGVIGRPSLASADKGRRLLDALVRRAEPALKMLRSDDESPPPRG